MHIIFTYNFLKGSKGYKSGFNGQLKDDEIYGEGDAYSAQYWEYDTRLGRRWNLDPVVKPWQSGFVCFSNIPSIMIDPNGDDDFSVSSKGEVTWVGKNDKADNYYAGPIQRDENGNITNKLITSTKAGSLNQIQRKQITYRNDKGKIKQTTGQRLDFGDNAIEAEQVFMKLSDYTNLEFSYHRYNDNHTEANQETWGKNIVYTSFLPYMEVYGSDKVKERTRQLEIHIHFHPKENSYVQHFGRNQPSDDDISFKNAIRSTQNKFRKFAPSVPSARFYIYMGPTHSLIDYTDAR